MRKCEDSHPGSKKSLFACGCVGGAVDLFLLVNQNFCVRSMLCERVTKEYECMLMCFLLNFSLNESVSSLAG